MVGSVATLRHCVEQSNGDVAVSASPTRQTDNGSSATPGPESHAFSFVWSLDRSSDVGRAMLAVTRRLAESGSDTPQLDALVLLGFVLGVNKAWLYAHPTRELTESEIVHYEALVRRRMGTSRSPI